MVIFIVSIRIQNSYFCSFYNSKTTRTHFFVHVRMEKHFLPFSDTPVRGGLPQRFQKYLFRCQKYTFLMETIRAILHGFLKCPCFRNGFPSAGELQVYSRGRRGNTHIKLYRQRPGNGRVSLLPSFISLSPNLYSADPNYGINFCFIPIGRERCNL